MIWVVVKKVGEPARPAQIESPEGLDGWLALLELTKADWIDAFRWSERVHCYVDDDGLCKRLPVNFFMNGVTSIVGHVVFSVRGVGGDDVGFGSEQGAQRFADRFNANARVPS